MVAEALNEWLPRVIQAVKPFLSSEIEKGVKWSNEIDGALEGTRFGIICLTPDNLNNDWIHYEAGALSKTKDALLWTFLLELKQGDVKQPLGKFQHTLAEKADVLKLLKSINVRVKEIGENFLDDLLLLEIFEDMWPKLELKLKNAGEAINLKLDSSNAISKENLRNEADKLDEILEILRSGQRQEIFERTYENLFDPPLREPPRPIKYTEVRFYLLHSVAKYDVIEIKDYVEQFFPNAEISIVAKTDKEFFVAIVLEPARDMGSIRKSLNGLKIKTEYDVTNQVAIDYHGLKRTIPM